MSWRIRAGVMVALSTALAAAAGTAGAQDGARGPAGPAAGTASAAPTGAPAQAAPAGPKSELALELTMHAGSVTDGSVLGLSPLLRASIQLRDFVAVEAVWGAAFASLSPDAGEGSSTLRIGNPWIAGYYTGAFGKLKLRAGAGLTIPAASVPAADPMSPASVLDDAAAVAAYGEAAGMRGVWAPWLFAVDYLTIAVPVTATLGVAEHVNVVGDLGFGYMIYTGDITTKENRTVLRFGAAGSYTAGIVQAGLRFQAVWFPSDDGDNAQLAIEPYARFNFGVPFARVGLLLNLDAPRGFAFGENHVWGLRVEGGAAF